MSSSSFQCLLNGLPVPTDVNDALYAFYLKTFPQTVEPVVEAVKPKILKVTKVAPKPESKPAPAPAPKPETTPATSSVDANAWRTHPSRLQSINANCCVARGISEKNPLVGTRTGDIGYNGGRIFPETQCRSKPASGSKLCEKHIERDALSKAKPNERIPRWYGRLDEETIYPFALVVGCAYFLENYPNGITGDSFRPGTSAPSLPIVQTEKKARTKKTEPKTVEPEPTVAESVAVDIAPKTVDWHLFMYEDVNCEKRLYTRNLTSNKVYYTDSQKHNLDDMADRYVGRWVNDKIDITADDSDTD
jgi:hypothetical protein